MNIFVGSLPFSVEEADLRGYFEEYGAVESVKIISDKFTGRSKGFGFVEFENEGYQTRENIYFKNLDDYELMTKSDI